MTAVYPTTSGDTTSCARPPRKLLDQVRDALRVKHYPYRNEQARVGVAPAVYPHSPAKWVRHPVPDK